MTTPTPETPREEYIRLAAARAAEIGAHASGATVDPDALTDLWCKLSSEPWFCRQVVAFLWPNVALADWIGSPLGRHIAAVLAPELPPWSQQEAANYLGMSRSSAQYHGGEGNLKRVGNQLDPTSVVAYGRKRGLPYP